jgi:quercetin dioxygenase-like cupin family protein
LLIIKAKKMKKEKNILTYTIAAILLAALNIYSSAPAQRSEVRRTELQRYDLDAPGREVIQSRIDFDEGTTFGKHSHPGEEIIYVIEGLLEYQVEGKSTVTLKAGEVLFVPARTIHAAKNVGIGNAAELATYIAEKGKPLLVMIK